jgi:CBS domain-containing protein
MLAYVWVDAFTPGSVMTMFRLRSTAATSPASNVANRLRPFFGRWAAVWFLGTAICLTAAILVVEFPGGRTPANATLLLLLLGAVVALGLARMPALAFAQPITGRHGPKNVPSDQDEEAFPRLFAKQVQIFDTLAGDCGRLLTNDLLVRDLMTTGVTTALPETPVERLAVLMRELDVHHLIVCSAEKQVLGVVSDRDVQSCAGKKAEDIMTRAPLTLPSDALVRTAMSYLIERRISSLPIVDEGRLVGIFTTTDALMAFQCTMQVVRAAAAHLVPKGDAEVGAAGFSLMTLSP